MAKLDEITELLTEEIEGFNRSITKLEKLSKDLGDIRIKADSSNIQYQLKEHLREQERIMYGHAIEVQEINNAVKAAKLTPKWLMALFCTASAISILTIGYFGYPFIQFEEIKAKSYNKGELETFSQLKGYFDDHPIIYKDFQKWSKKQDSISDKK